MPICQESVGAGVVGRQVAGRVATCGVALVVQNLRRRHIDVLPARLAEAITQVDVLHVHEIALVEARYLIEGGSAAATGTIRIASRRGVRWARSAPAGIPPSTGWISRTGRRRRACRRGSGWGGDAPTGKPTRRGRGSAVPTTPPSASVQPPPATVDAARSPLHIRVGDHHKLRLRRDLLDRAVHRGAVAQIAAGVQQPGVGIALQPLLPVRRPSNRYRR